MNWKVYLQYSKHFFRNGNFLADMNHEIRMGSKGFIVIMANYITR